MPGFIDQTGRRLFLSLSPLSGIISVVPSLTELLYDLGLDEEITGITKFCIHPKSWFFSKTKVGGTKNLNIELIRKLEPDLIVANKEENNREQIEELANQFPIWISDISTIQEAFNAIAEIGAMTSKADEAENLVRSIKEKFTLLEEIRDRATVCYLIWRDPYMTVGGDTFIHSMLDAAGFENIYKNEKRYPEVTLKELAKRKPDYIFLSSEPFPFKEKHVAEIKQEQPAAKIILVDGEMFSWYGSRMLYAPSYFLNLWKYGLHGK